MANNGGAGVVKRLIQDPKADFFHSSAYGKAQSGAAMGTAATDRNTMNSGAAIAKRIIQDQKADFFHSSAYGKAQSGGMIGAASTESFEKRQEIEKNRKSIGKYNDSMVAEQRFNPEAREGTGTNSDAWAATSGTTQEEAKVGRLSGQEDLMDLYQAAGKRAQQSSAQGAGPLKRAEIKKAEAMNARNGVGAREKQGAQKGKAGNGLSLSQARERRAEQSARFAGTSRGQVGNRTNGMNGVNSMNGAGRAGGFNRVGPFGAGREN